MTADGDGPDPPTPMLSVIVRSHDELPKSCRCGTRLPSGTARLVVRGVPPNVATLFERQAFCSRKCVRAFFLEAMETLDGLSTQGAEETVSDLRTVYQATAHSFADLFPEGTKTP